MNEFAGCYRAKFLSADALGNVVCVVPAVTGDAPVKALGVDLDLIPAPGSFGWVVFEGGDPSLPVWIGKATPVVRTATVTATSPFTIKMADGSVVVNPARSLRYYPVVGDVVRVESNGSYFVSERISPVGPYGFTPAVSYSGGGGSFGNPGTTILDGEWDFDGARIVGQMIGSWGVAASGGAGAFQVNVPVPGTLAIGAVATGQPMIGSGFWYDSSGNQVVTALLRLMTTTTCHLYRTDLQGTAWEITAAVPWSPQQGDSFVFNFAYRPA
jgi:hypothetical protein